MIGEKGRPSRPIMSAVSNAQWVDPDYLVFAQEGVLVAQRFDQADERIVGAPVSIAEPVDRFLTSGRAMFTTSRTGTIAYHSYANVARLVWVDRTGKEVGTVGAPGDYLNVRLSPDGGTVLFERTKPGIGTWDLWTIDLARGVETRLTSDPGSEAFPRHSVRGRESLQYDPESGTKASRHGRRGPTASDWDAAAAAQRCFTGRAYSPFHRAHSSWHGECLHAATFRPRHAVSAVRIALQ
jgi:hypothetical protein